MRSLRLEKQLERLSNFDQNFRDLTVRAASCGSFEGWFLGPKAENEELLTQLILEAIWKHCEFRRAYQPDDPTYITSATRQTEGYVQAVKRLRAASTDLFSRLQLSAPISSMRSQGHMLWDQVLPAMVGYFGAMLYNQNNVAAEASPLTTHLEISVGNDLCRMLGFPVPPEDAPPTTVRPWGHITCDGSVANLEGLWAARNVKFFPLALRAAIRHGKLRKARTLQVPRLDGQKASLVDLTDWELLNLKIDDVVSLPYVLQANFGIDPSYTADAVADFDVQNLGLAGFYRQHLPPHFALPLAFAPSTAHYSWPKSAALLGLGKANLKTVHVDFNARMNIESLEEQLRLCITSRTPVIAVVAVIGSTEENAVDHLSSILHIREQLRQEGLDFAVHADAAWGGYYASLFRTDDEMNSAHGKAQGLAADRVEEQVPESNLSPYVKQQIQSLAYADSVTVDPHKFGYVPYPAGALCYRNSALRDLVSLKAPVVFHSQSEPTVGIYGVEGSKPGAAAASVFLAHKVIRPTYNGYGRIIRQCIWTSKRMYCQLATMPDTRVKLVCLQMLPAERDELDEDAVNQQKAFIRQNFVNRTNEELESFLKADRNAAALFCRLGSDGVILTFSFNFRNPQTGKLNQSLEKLNLLNQKIFEKCSLRTPPSSVHELNQLKLILTSSSFSTANYGPSFINHYCGRLGVTPTDQAEVNFLISTAMDPWTTETSKGSFLGLVEQTLRDVAHQALDEMMEVADYATA